MTLHNERVTLTGRGCHRLLLDGDILLVYDIGQLCTLKDLVKGVGDLGTTDRLVHLYAIDIAIDILHLKTGGFL